MVAKKRVTPTDDEALCQKWVNRVQREKKAHKKWHEQAEKAEGAYRDENKSADVDRRDNPFPVWWSTCQITHAAIFAKAPKPDVRKRYNDQGPSEDKLAQAVQRALEYTIDTTGFSDHGHLIVDDFLNAALGIGKVELNTETGVAPVIDPSTQQPIMDEDGKPMTQKVIVHQSLRLRHFSWEKFGWEPCKDWEACDWIRFQHDMTADEVKDRFGVDLDAGDAKEGTGQKYEQTAAVQEIWDRKNRQQLFITDSHPVPLEVNDDPLRLEGFYPCPKPMFCNIKSNELTPKPDYSFVRRLCENVQRLSQRIQALSKNIKDVGFYDAQLGELAQLNNAPDGTRVPIKNLAERLNAAGPGRMSFDSVIANQDNTGKVAVLRELIAQRDLEKNVLFETLGIADIVRGASVASETAAAQTIKSQWANVRIGPKVQAVAFFFRDVFRIMGEILAEHFEPEQLDRMAGMQLSPEDVAALKDDLARCYAIDIEADSTMASEDQEEKAQRLEMVQVITEYLNALLPQVQAGTMDANLMKTMLLFTVRSFKYGRQVEDAINALPDAQAQLQQFTQQAQQLQQQLQQMQEQNQQLQKQAQDADQADSARKDVQTKADAELKQAQTAKTAAEAQNIANQAHAESAVHQSHQQAQQGMAVALQTLAATADQLNNILPTIQQAAVLTAQKPKAIKVHRGPDGKIAGAEVVA